MSTLAVDGLSKRFGAVQALDQVSAQFHAGEIHALLGENGAGKSTFVGVLAGFVKPDAGSVTLDGHSIPLGNAYSCRRAGIAMVHQHFMLVPEFTVAENLSLANLETLTATLDAQALAKPALDLGDRLGWHVEPGAKIRDLPVGVQQRLEILKVLSDDAPVMILDEPTAVLSPVEVEDLMRVLRGLREQGKTIILIAHKLSEVSELCDRVTVLRRGRVVASAEMAGTTSDQLAEWMVGDLPPTLQKPDLKAGENILVFDQVWAKGERGEDALRGINLNLRQGEILGIGGVDGNGQVELAEVAAGIRDADRGKIERPNSVAYIPQDRQADGLVLSMDILDNVLLGGYRQPRFSRGPLIEIGKAKAWATDLIGRFDIRAEGPSTQVGNLSGGNQQKVVVSRALDEAPDLLVAVNPTRGLDIRATEFVQRQILEARSNGSAVLLISTDLDELALLADRTQFLSRGTLQEATDAASLFGGQ